MERERGKRRKDTERERERGGRERVRTNMRESARELERGK